MPPPKRKRSERASDGPRPSPHRPSETSLGQHDRDFHDGSGRGRGHGRNTRRNDRRDSFQTQQQNSSGPPTSPTAQRPTTSPSSSQTSTFVKPLVPSITGPSTPAPPPENEPDLPFYAYENLTGERLAAWLETGRLEVVRHGRQSRDDVDVTELSCLFQEFIRSVLDGRLSPADAGECIKDILGAETHEPIKDSFSFEPHTLFVDTLSIMIENELDLFRPQLRDFLVATGVSTALMREVLDAPLLQKLGLIRETFIKLGIRQSTNLLYRQANYNLLREETEGYSKLITELFTTSSSEPPTADMVLSAFERVKGLIGTFDLDVGRVLDVTLDVFAAVLIKQFRFFVKFLRVSSWWPRSPSRLDGVGYSGGLPSWGLPTSAGWITGEEDELRLAQLKADRDVIFWERARDVHLDAFFELGGHQVLGNKHGLELDSEDENDARRRWISITNTTPPPGNRVAAQLLGFKLRFYISEARNPEDVLPANLLYLAALLIKIGFIALVDLYPHLWPLDHEMEALREKKMKELEEKERANRPGGGTNALMTAGALTDDTMPATLPTRQNPGKTTDEPKTNGTVEEERTKLPEPMEQKATLLICLLTIGAIPESLFMLGRFPWLPEAFPEILDRIHRILHCSVDKIYQQSRPVSSRPPTCPTKLIADADQSNAAKGSVTLSSTPQKKFLRWPFPDKFDSGENYRFYWDEWADNVPICQTVDDVFTLCGSLLNISGVNIGKDEALLSKIASIGHMSLTVDTSQANLSRWQDLLRRLLVPALSHTKPNASVVNAIWSLLKRYPTPVRYGIYAEWYEGQISRLPAMRAAFARSRLETLSTMKRLSLTNLSDMAKALAKTSFSSPGVVFKVALDQIESYANLIDAFVECAKYFTELSYDVLVWSLLSSLGGQARSRTQEASILLTSKWLQALAKFSGQVFRRYSNMDPTPVIQYVDHQLFNGNSTDLIILKEFISTMGGVVQTLDFTDDQIMAMSGGDVLRRQTLISGQDRRFESAQSAKRLMDALVDSGLARQLLINLAQYRQSAIYKISEDEAHIKYLSSVVDDSHQILVQFLDFLRSHLEPNAFERIFPSVISLMSDFGLNVSIAFLIGRDSLADRMFPRTKEEHDRPSTAAGRDDEGDVSMGDGHQVAETAITGKDETGDKTADETEKLPAATQTHARKVDPILDTLQPIIDSVQASKSVMIWSRISSEFYVMFWTFQLGDLAVPGGRYSTERDRVVKEVDAITRDRTDMTRAGVDKKKQKKKELLEIAQSLIQEQKEHETRYLKNKIHITRRFKSWFPVDVSDVKINTTSDLILEECLLPRLMLSAADAEYCHKLVRALHDWGAPNFKLMSLYDRLFNANRLRSIIFSCTVREAEHVGRYLRLVLNDLAAWHKDKDAYEKDAFFGSRNQKERTLIGFCTSLDSNSKPQGFVEHGQFQDLLYGWHKNLNTALKAALSGIEWMHIRNSITILKSVLNAFPAVDFMAKQFVTQLKTITDRESGSKTATDGEESHRVDLSVAAQTALSELQKRRSKWVIVQDFRPNTAGEISNDAKSAETSALRPSAPDFKSQSAPRPPPRTTSMAISEDGEIKDRDCRQSAGAQPASPTNGTPKDSIPFKPPLPATQPAWDSPVKSSRPETRSSTPKPTPALSSVPINTPRSESTKSTTLSAPPPGLPSRPDVPVPGLFSQDRHGQSRLRDANQPRDTRGPREKDYWDSSRDNRDPIHNRLDRTRDFPLSDRPRGAEPVSREAGRPSDKDWSTKIDLPLRRPEVLPPQPPHEWDPKGPRDRGPLQQNARGSSDMPRGPRDHRDNRGTVTALGLSAAGASLQDPPMNPKRAAMFVVEPLPPSRLHDMERSHERTDRTPGWDDPRDINPSQSMFHRRSERFGAMPSQMEGNRDDRHNRLPLLHEPRDGPREPAASSFRDRVGDWDERSRDAQPFGVPPRGPEPDYRVPRGHEPEHHPALHQDQSYGRLNNTAPEIPSGPRGRGRGITRNSQAVATSRSEDRLTNEGSRASSPEWQPPTGPAGRGRRFESGPGLASPTNTGPQPPTDRFRQGGGSGPPTPVPGNAPPSTPVPSGMHPDRLANIEVAPPVSAPNVSSRPISSPVTGQGRPLNSQTSRPSPGSFAVNSPTTEGIPTGPSKKVINSINNTLSNANTGGNARRQPPPHRIPNTDAHILAGGSPAVAQPERFEQARAEQHPAERIPLGNDGTRSEHERNRREREKTDRSTRSSRRNSHELDRGRSPDRGRDRERRSGISSNHAAGGGREERELIRRSTQESLRGRDVPDHRHDSRDDHESHRDRDRREPEVEGFRHHHRIEGGRGDDWSQKSGATRGGPRDDPNVPPRNDGRHEGREDRGRKRRSEEGLPPGREEKRVKR